MQLEKCSSRYRSSVRCLSAIPFISVRGVFLVISTGMIRRGVMLAVKYALVGRRGEGEVLLQVVGEPAQFRQSSTPVEGRYPLCLHASKVIVKHFSSECRHRSRARKTGQASVRTRLSKSTGLCFSVLDTKVCESLILVWFIPPSLRSSDVRLRLPTRAPA